MLLKLPEFDFKTKIIVVILCLFIGFVFFRVYQPQTRTLRIYEQGLRNYENGNYSNAYYLFSRIGHLSSLKPVAIYRQALCAKSLGDTKSEIENYKNLFTRYPADKLSVEAKYNMAQLIVDSNPKKAKKYFDEVLKSTNDTDYKIASAYYNAKILVKQTLKDKMSDVEKANIEEAFRTYLDKYPTGRLAIDVANVWKTFNPKMPSDDYTLVSRAYMLAGQYNTAKEILSKTNIKDSWAIQVSNNFALGENAKARQILQDGISKYSNSVDKKDYVRAIDDYLKQSVEIYKPVSELFNIAKGQNKDYIWALKCRYTLSESKYSCYNSLYENYPNGDYAQEALANVILGRVFQRDYYNVKNLATMFEEKYPDSELLPMVMFWRAKIEQNTYNPAYVEFYNNIIRNYPDSYYAYRAFWNIKHLNSSVINVNLSYRPVDYPYHYPHKGDILYSLILANDYDMLKKYTDDEFIKSWAEYKKGNYSTSLHLAQNAINKLKLKPPKSDRRWKLVYPQNYYIQVNNYSGQYKNNNALIMSIVKEESYFNAEAQSAVGAIGLMQLMPATAHEVGSKNELQFNTKDLFNPELNLRVGNLYYFSIRSMLNGNDIMAIAAYNGGIGSVQRWQKSLKYADIDEFIEQIPYEETKNYVKKVFRSYWNYTRIYQQ